MDDKKDWKEIAIAASNGERSADKEVERLRGELILQKDLNLDAMQRLQEKDELIAELRQGPSWLDQVAVQIAGPAGRHSVSSENFSYETIEDIAVYAYRLAEELIAEGKRREGK